MNSFKQKDKENKDKNELKKLIEDRIKEYELANEYFKENNLPINLVKGQKDKKILCNNKCIIFYLIIDFANFYLH